MLKRAAAKPKFFTLAEFIIPTDKQWYNQILKMAQYSKQILFEVSAAAAYHLLNKRVLNKKFKIGELVYIPDRLLKKTSKLIKRCNRKNQGYHQFRKRLHCGND